MDKNKCNILLMIRSFWGGGAEKEITVLGSGLADNENYNVFLLYYHDEEKTYPISEKCKIIKIPETNFEESIKYIKKIKLENKINITISSLVPLNNFNVNTKVNDFIICFEENNPEKKGILEKMTEIYSKADCIRFQTKTVQNLFNENIKNKSVILPNLINISCTASLERSNKIVNLARLVPQKNHKMLIKAFAKFHLIHPEYKLYIYGDGPLKDDLIKLQKENKLEECLFFEGQIENIFEVIKDAKISVLSSNFEGFSNSLLECLAMGIATISTKVEGALEIIEDHKNGILVDIDDHEQLFSALIELAENDLLRKSLEEKAKIDTSKYKKENSIKEWENFINKIITKLKL